jgi:hypothetical protein
MITTITVEQLINAIKMSTETMTVIVPDDDHENHFPSDFSDCAVCKIKFINPTSLIEAICGEGE